MSLRFRLVVKSLELIDSTIWYTLYSCFSLYYNSIKSKSNWETETSRRSMADKRVIGISHRRSSNKARYKYTYTCMCICIWMQTLLRGNCFFNGDKGARPLHWLLRVCVCEIILLSLRAFSFGKNGGINASMLANNCCHVKYIEHSSVALANSLCVLFDSGRATIWKSVWNWNEKSNAIISGKQPPLSCVSELFYLYYLFL